MNPEYRPVNDSGALGRMVPVALVTVGILVASYLLVKVTQYKFHLDRIESNRAAFNATISRYSFPSSFASKKSEVSVTGKVLPIDRKTMAVDELYYDLPDQMRARNPSEVGTLAWVDYEPILVGTYATGQACAYKCTLWLVDNSDSRIMERREFMGTTPPEQKNWRGDAYGLKPDYIVVAFLKNEDPPIRLAQFGHLTSASIRSLIRFTFYVSWGGVVLGLSCLVFVMIRKRRA